MTTPIDPQRLLEDTLAPDEPFRAASLEATLQAVRQRRERRRRQRVSLVAAGVLFAGAAALFYPSQRAPTIAPLAPAALAASSGGPSIVATGPMRPEMVVVTRLGALERVASDPSTVWRVTTGGTATPVSNIDDAGLFTLLAGRPAAIVRPNGTEAELLLLEAGEMAGLPAP